MAAIRIEELTKRFGETVALDGISLTVALGELFFLLGPSGCGKTTLLRAIAGFVTPDTGRIFFGQDDVTKLAPHQRQTGMMFQSYALWPHLTVWQNVAFGLQERKVAAREIEERVGEALRLVRMAEYGGRKINELSGGQQQRVALARALVIRPQCLLLDEPLSNLDAKLRLEMRTEIRRICKEFSLTAIYVTHDQKEALSVADRMAVLDQGRIVQIGRPSEIYRRPASRSVAEFIGESNFLTGVVERLDSDRVVLRTVDAVLESALVSPDLRAGDEVTILIRPEALGIENGPAYRPNTLPGRIGESLYLGELAQYRFETAAGALKISELNPRIEQRTASEEVHATVLPDDVVILRS